MAEDLMASFEAQLEAANVPQEGLEATAELGETKPAQAAEVDPVASFQQQLEGGTKAEKGEDKKRDINSTASLLGLEPTELVSGGEEFKAGLARNTPEAPTVLGGLKEVGKTIVGGLTGAFGKESIFAGGTIGEFLGAKLASGAREEAITDVNDRIAKIEKENPELAGKFKKLTMEKLEEGDPTALQVAADVGLVALDVLTMGKGKAVTSAVKVAGSEALKRGGKEGFKQFIKTALPGILKGEFLASTGIGAGFGGGQAIKEGADILSQEALYGAAIGATVGAAAVGAPIFLGAVGKKIASKLPLEAREMAAKEVSDLATRITQGKKSDAQKAARALTEVDANNVKTYDDLAERINEKIAVIGDAQDKLLATDKRLFSLDELKNKVKVGEREVEQNFVSEALDDLAELYESTNELENLAKVQNIKDKAAGEGLSVLEINKLAREYGAEFKNKAFTKTGDAKTSVSAGRFENNRKGLKNKSRELFGNEDSKVLDAKMSDLIQTKGNIDKMIEKVNDLSKRVENRSLFKKAGGVLADIVDTATGGIAGSFARRLLIPRGGGLKVLNALDLEEELIKNLKNFSNSAEKAGLKKQAGELSDIVKKAEEESVRRDIKEAIKKTEQLALPAPRGTQSASTVGLAPIVPRKPVTTTGIVAPKTKAKAVSLSKEIQSRISAGEDITSQLKELNALALPQPKAGFVESSRSVGASGIALPETTERLRRIQKTTK